MSQLPNKNTSVTSTLLFDNFLYFSIGRLSALRAPRRGHRFSRIASGVAEFQLALARGPNDWPNPKKVIPLSARPSELELFLALDEDSEEGKAFKAAGAKQKRKRLAKLN